MENKITPHIHENEALGMAIIKTLKEYQPQTILDIGASDGAGSTKVLAKHAPQATIHAIEYSEPRYKVLVKRYKKNSRVIPHFCAPTSKLMTTADVRKIQRDFPKWDIWRSYGLQGAIDRLEGSRKKIATMENQEGIQSIKTQYGIKAFDLVLMDGGPFSGKAELEAVMGSKVIVLDDVIDIKNFGNYRRLSASPEYKLREINLGHRNGYAIFVKQ